MHTIEVASRKMCKQSFWRISPDERNRIGSLTGCCTVSAAWTPHERHTAVTRPALTSHCAQVHSGFSGSSSEWRYGRSTNDYVRNINKINDGDKCSSTDSGTYHINFKQRG